MSDILHDLEKSVRELGVSASNSPSAAHREALLRAKQRIEQLSAKPLACATVLRIQGEGDDKTVLISCEGRFFETRHPIDKTIKAGDTVKIRIDVMQIVDVMEPIQSGNVGVFRAPLGDAMAEVSLSGQVRVVYMNLPLKPEQGDRVVVDNSGSVILANLGNDDSRYSLSEDVSVEWEDVCGQATAKDAFKEALVSPIKDAALLEAYGKKRIKGILLIGPGGCGKTMLGKAAATEVARLYGAKSFGEGFIYVKGAEILTKFVGDPETAIRSIFHRARKFKKKQGFPAVIFWDEIDAVGKKRGTGMSSDVNDTIVPTLLAEMDGLTESGAILIGATNRPDILDPALVRDGRFDYRIAVERPTRESGLEIAEKNLRKTRVSSVSFGGDAAQKAAELLVGKLYSDAYPLWEVARRRGEKSETLHFCLRHIVNGAMIVGIVEKAKKRAIDRDKAAKGELEAKGDQSALADWKPEGITIEDIDSAIARTHEENRSVNVSDELGEFVQDFKDEVVGIQKLRQVSN